MENLDPFWYGVALLFIWIAPISLATTLIAGVFWLIRRSKVSLMLFLALLTITAMTGVTLVVSLVLMELRP
jgi:hypothetical protein